jgi:hypothetical protein
VPFKPVACGENFFTVVGASSYIRNCLTLYEVETDDPQAVVAELGRNDDTGLLSLSKKCPTMFTRCSSCSTGRSLNA